jgi:hypothetical protein
MEEMMNDTIHFIKYKLAQVLLLKKQLQKKGGEKR